MEACGFNHVVDFPGMAIDLLELNEVLKIPSNLTIEREGDLKMLELMVRIFTISIWDS